MSPRAATTDAHTSRAVALKQEKLPQRESCTPQLECCPHSPQVGKSPSSNKDPAQPKIKNKKKKKIGDELSMLNSPLLIDNINNEQHLCAMLYLHLKKRQAKGLPWW